MGLLTPINQRVFFCMYVYIKQIYRMRSPYVVSPDDNPESTGPVGQLRISEWEVDEMYEDGLGLLGNLRGEGVQGGEQLNKQLWYLFGHLSKILNKRERRSKWKVTETTFAALLPWYVDSLLDQVPESRLKLLVQVAQLDIAIRAELEHNSNLPNHLVILLKKHTTDTTWRWIPMMFLPFYSFFQRLASDRLQALSKYDKATGKEQKAIRTLVGFQAKISDMLNRDYRSLGPIACRQSIDDDTFTIWRVFSNCQSNTVSGLTVFKQILQLHYPPVYRSMFWKVVLSVILYTKTESESINNLVPIVIRTMAGLMELQDVNGNTPSETPRYPRLYDRLISSYLIHQYVEREEREKKERESRERNIKKPSAIITKKIYDIILNKSSSPKDDDNNLPDETRSKILGKMQAYIESIHEHQKNLNMMTRYLIKLRESGTGIYQNSVSTYLTDFRLLKNHLNDTLQNITNELAQDITWLSIQEKKTLLEVSTNLIPAYTYIQTDLDDAIQCFGPLSKETTVVS